MDRRDSETPLQAPSYAPSIPGERLVRAATSLLVLGVAALAFVVSFEAISAYAVATGAFPPELGWCAPLLVDTFTTAATLVILSRSRAGLPVVYAWVLVAVSTIVSLALNVAHAPDRLDARLVAALPSLAQLAAVELVMSEARRASTAHPALHPRNTAKDQVRHLLAIERAGGDRLTGPALAAQLGISPCRAQELLKGLRGQLAATESAA